MHPSLTLRQRLGMCWLMLALVLSPALGLVHQVVHGQGLAKHPAHSYAAAAVNGHTVPGQATDAVHALFSGHAKADCVLLDQMALGHALLAKATVALQAVPAAVPVVDASPQLADQHAAPFHARGPPLQPVA